MAHEEGHEEELLTPTIGQGTHKPGPPPTFEEQLEGYDALLKIRGADKLIKKQPPVAEQAWNLIPETGQEAIKDTLKFTGNVIADTYQDARTIKGVEWLSPHQIGTAAVIRAGEWALPPVAGVLDIPRQYIESGLEKTLPEKYKSLAPGLSVATEVAIPYGLIFRKAKMLNRVFDARVTNPFQLPGLYGGVGQGFEVSRSIFKKDKYLGPRQINWENFGYKYKQLPTIVRRAANMEEFDTVSSSLNDFYSLVDRFASSKLGVANIRDIKNRIPQAVARQLKNFDIYFENPLDGTPYRVGVKNGRYTLISARSNLERAALAKRYSSITEANAQLASVKKITEGNKTLKKQFLDKKAELIQKQKEIIEDVRVKQAPFIPGKPGSTKGAISSSIQAWGSNQIQSIGRQITELLQGAFYGEHGYNLQNKKMQALIKGNGWEDIFQLGDGQNFHIVQEVMNPKDASKNFQLVKNAFEEVINSTDAFGRDLYPEIVVGYNPKWDGVDFKIRFERTRTIKKRSMLIDGIETDVIVGAAFKVFNYASDALTGVDKNSLRAAARSWLIRNSITPAKLPKLTPLTKTPSKGKVNLNPVKTIVNEILNRD